MVAGTNLLNHGGESYKIKDVIAHELYQPSTVSNDIALIKLEDPIKMKELIQKIDLPSEDTPEGTELVLSGWGTTAVWFCIVEHLLFDCFWVLILVSRKST